MSSASVKQRDMVTWAALLVPFEAPKSKHVLATPPPFFSTATLSRSGLTTSFSDIEEDDKEDDIFLITTQFNPSHLQNVAYANRNDKTPEVTYIDTCKERKLASQAFVPMTIEEFQQRVSYFL